MTAARRMSLRCHGDSRISCSGEAREILPGDAPGHDRVLPLTATQTFSTNRSKRM